ncbi:deoxyribodipyrimidine photo-lyase [Leptolyngbya sp. FACHB-541]|uniref:FAD-binding domain-containing protein n=1 Tax=Leptolyngbya sp. FACHB-541 TaxID=2692810 RepID=UPI00168420ED|nr:FAD-binding domain-containing protein [Leptolyngbya sp. FACHB-541]MBD1870401.1 deoxyribodipyrimidine photo-lyase [Cyanobacteria bacterium FACHB-471]MBD1996757.1 deoxyribodipyrimidine photo-lyase [Leptolyngbya sp. FACHB-541]
MSDLILFWHRRDLRISDNVGLAAARQQSQKVVGVFCLDPLILERDDVAPARVTYMMGSLRELGDRYTQAGSQLIVLRDQPVRAIPALAKALSAKAVFCNRGVEPYGRERDRTVSEALKQVGIPLQTFWDQLLHSPKEIVTGAGQPYTVYTPFWRNWRAKAKMDPVETLQAAEGLSPNEQKAAQQAGSIDLPTAKDLGFEWENELLLAPGEQAAQERLEDFCEREQAIDDYKEQRNFPAVSGTSHLSAALKFGTIGVRTVWAAADTALKRSRSDETASNIQTWQQELAWREFYQHAMYAFPSLAEGAFREPFKTFPWGDNEAHFQAWCEGMTGYPIVDAAMRQMNQLGWMHNRCRMIVASFLTKDLLVDLRRGEKYFMQRLYDADLSANNGGWQWSASSGMDPKPLRIFNPASQAKKFDPEAEYIREWLPELRSVDTEFLVTGEIPAEERDRCNYPHPIVDHKKQQSLFKQIYQQQKQQSS